MTTASSSPVLLYDGDCGFCAANVQLILRHERLHTLRFAALQSAFGAGVLARHPELRGLDTMLWVDPATEDRPERILARSNAALRVVRYLGGWWRLLSVARLVPRPIRDAGYDWIARNRHRLPGFRNECLIPDSSVRVRFLER